MNPRTGELYRLSQETLARMSDAQRQSAEALLQAQHDAKFIALDDVEWEELEPLAPPQRKNKMRNKPCRCGSGIKFKRCCWSKFL